MLSYEQYPTIIYDNIKLYSYNVCKNSLIVNIILETQSLFDIIFIQEPLWSVIWFIPSSTSCKGDVLVEVSHYPNWTTFSRTSLYASEFPRVIAYINICIFSLCFSLWNDILNHRDLSCISFFNQGSIYFWLMYIQAHLSRLWSILRILKSILIMFSSWLETLTLEIVFET